MMDTKMKSQVFHTIQKWWKTKQTNVQFKENKTMQKKRQPEETETVKNMILQKTLKPPTRQFRKLNATNSQLFLAT